MIYFFRHPIRGFRCPYRLLLSCSQFFSFCFRNHFNWPILTSPPNQRGYLSAAQMTTCPWSAHCKRGRIASAGRLSTCSAALPPRTHAPNNGASKQLTPNISQGSVGRATYCKNATEKRITRGSIQFLFLKNQVFMWISHFMELRTLQMSLKIDLHLRERNLSVGSGKLTEFCTMYLETLILESLFNFYEITCIMCTPSTALKICRHT